jgi:hypothetical protein
MTKPSPIAAWVVAVAMTADRAADVAVARHALALEAVRQPDANASAQLALEAMFIKMRRSDRRAHSHFPQRQRQLPPWMDPASRRRPERPAESRSQVT